MTLERVDLEVGSARVVGKGGKERLVPIGSAAPSRSAAISTAGGGPARRAVFLDDDGRPLSPTAVYKGIRSLGARAGISGVRCSPHTFRHTFATRYLLLGCDLLALARLLGHSPHSLEVTQRYVTLLEPISVLRTGAFHRAIISPGLAGFARRGRHVSRPSEGSRDDRQPVDRRGLRVLALDFVGVEVDVAADHLEGRVAQDPLEAEHVATVEQSLANVWRNVWGFAARRRVRPARPAGGGRAGSRPG